MTQLKNLCVADVFITCCDGLSGLETKVVVTWPQATVQTCVVHLIRATNRYVSRTGCKTLSAVIKAKHEHSSHPDHIRARAISDRQYPDRSAAALPEDLDDPDDLAVLSGDQRGLVETLRVKGCRLLHVVDQRLAWALLSAEIGGPVISLAVAVTAAVGEEFHVLSNRGRIAGHIAFREPFEVAVLTAHLGESDRPVLGDAVVVHRGEPAPQNALEGRRLPLAPVMV
nr:transposase [Streptosporangium amethystogenes]